MPHDWRSHASADERLRALGIAARNMRRSKRVELDAGISRVLVEVLFTGDSGVLKHAPLFLVATLNAREPDGFTVGCAGDASARGVMIAEFRRLLAKVCADLTPEETRVTQPLATAQQYAPIAPVRWANELPAPTPGKGKAAPNRAARLAKRAARGELSDTLSPRVRPDTVTANRTGRVSGGHTPLQCSGLIAVRSARGDTGTENGAPSRHAALLRAEAQRMRAAGLSARGAASLDARAASLDARAGEWRAPATGVRPAMHTALAHDAPLPECEKRAAASASLDAEVAAEATREERWRVAAEKRAARDAAIAAAKAGKE